MDTILTYRRSGNMLTYREQTIEIKTRPDGRMFLYQETPVRKYLSGLMLSRHHGENVYQIDIRRPGGEREFFLIELHADHAVLRTAKYNNSGSGQILSAPGKTVRRRAPGGRR